MVSDILEKCYEGTANLEATKAEGNVCTLVKEKDAELLNTFGNEKVPAAAGSIAR